jgi:hypothetical protein
VDEDVEGEDEDGDEEDDDDDDPDVPGAGGPSALTTPGVVASDGNMIETVCPIATVGSLAVKGTETARVVVVTS